MAYSTTVQRHKTREVGIGDHVVGGDQPDLGPVDDDDQHVRRRGDARADPPAGGGGLRDRPGDRAQEGGRRGASRRSATRSRIPLIADIHYDYRMALACLEATHRRRPAGRGQDPDQPGQHRRRGAVQGGRPQGPRQGHPDADRRQLGQPREGPDREVRLPLPRGDGRERPAAHRDGRGAWATS